METNENEDTTVQNLWDAAKVDESDALCACIYNNTISREFVAAFFVIDP